MERSSLLKVDAGVNLALGALLIVFPAPVVRAPGVPPAEPAFYPSILGAVLFGIGLALLQEARRSADGLVGLGLGGAVATNLSGGLVLTGWLVAGGLALPLRGHVILWALVGISSAEVLRHRRSGAESPSLEDSYGAPLRVT